MMPKRPSAQQLKVVIAFLAELKRPFILGASIGLCLASLSLAGVWSCRIYLVQDACVHPDVVAFTNADHKLSLSEIEVQNNAINQWGRNGFGVTPNQCRPFKK